MFIIRVTKEVLRNVLDCLENDGYGSGEPFAEAMEHGFLGMAGGLDYVVYRPWSVEFHDRCLEKNSGVVDNSTKFVVPVKLRSGKPPISRNYYS